jgi:hypothetical protein
MPAVERPPVTAEVASSGLVVAILFKDSIGPAGRTGCTLVEQSFEPIHGGGRVFRLILDGVRAVVARFVWRSRAFESMPPELFRPASLQYDDRADGIFPLLLNDEKPRSVRLAYKHQPGVEKRHEQLKTVFEVMPVNLKSPGRIEAFFFICFLAVLVDRLSSARSAGA